MMQIEDIDFTLLKNKRLATLLLNKFADVFMPTLTLFVGDSSLHMRKAKEQLKELGFKLEWDEEE